MGFFDLPAVSRQRGATCAACGLYKFVRSPKMEAFGKFNRRILCIGEAPGETEDIRGLPWQGKVGRRLQNAFKDLGFDLFDDCLSTNSTQCRPQTKSGANRTPTSNEIACCRNRVLSTIEESRPNLILLLGNAAIESVLTTRWKNDIGTVSKWRGWRIPDRHFNAWICPTFHPSFIERETKEVETIWMQDLARALELADQPVTQFADEENLVKVVDDASFILDLEGPVAFDFETTGLKPHDRTRHKVVMMSVCNSLDKAYSFMMDDVNRRYVRRFLNSNVEKIAQNMKFEDTWSRVLLNCEVKNWLWDTMLATHVLDNRPDITGLKFQVYVNFGLADYSSGVSEYLKSVDSKDGNAVNKISELIKTGSGRHRALVYCGMDSLFEYRLALMQMKALGFRD